MLASLLDALRLGLEFHPVAALVGATVAAAAWSRPRATVLPALGAVWLLAAWGVGDGVRIVASTLASGPASADTITWVIMVVWASVTLGVGYVLPAWAGAFVGRRVTFGTGWLSAIVVAAAVASALGRIVGGVG